MKPIDSVNDDFIHDFAHSGWFESSDEFIHHKISWSGAELSKANDLFAWPVLTGESLV